MKPVLECGRLWLDDDVLRMGDGVWRTSRLGGAERGYGEDVELSRALADGIEVMGIVPEHLVDFVRGEQAGAGGDGAAAVEVEDLQSGGSGDGDECAFRTHLEIGDGADRCLGHVLQGAGGVKIS